MLDNDQCVVIGIIYTLLLVFLQAALSQLPLNIFLIITLIVTLLYLILVQLYAKKNKRKHKKSKK